MSKNVTSVTACNITIGTAYRPDIAQVRDDMAAAGVPVLRTHHLFCTESLCPVVVGNLLVYRDDNHMSVSYASFIAPAVNDAIVPFVDWYSRPH